MDVNLSSNSLMIIKVEEKSKKPAIYSTELKHIPREDEDVRVSIWLMKNRPYFPKGFSDADETDDNSSDGVGESNFVPAPPPSRSGESGSHLIDVLRSSSGCSRTEETKECGIRQHSSAPISAPMKDCDKICYRSEVPLKRRLNTQEHNIAPSKLPRLNMPSQRPLCKGNVSSNVRPSDFVEPSTLCKQGGQGKPHSHSYNNNNNIEKMIVAKPSCSLNMLQASNEKTAGIVERFFKWLFPDA